MRSASTLAGYINLLCAAAAGVAVTAVLTLSVGCDGRASAADDPVTIRFWNGFTGPDGRTMLALVKKFNQQNPDVHVIMQRMDWGTYYNKLFVAGVGGRAPDLFVLHTDYLARFHRAGFLRPMDDLTGPGGIDAADFDPNVWAAVELNGDHLAIPLDIHLLGMFYNRTLFKRAGIVDAAGEARPPVTREEFLDAVRKLTRDTDGNGATDQWGYVFTWLRTNAYTLMRQHGGDVFNASLTETTINSPQNVRAMQFGADLIFKEKVAPSPANFGAFIGFRQGKVAIAFEGIYMLPELKRQQDLDWAAAPVPVMGDRPAAWANSHNLCIRGDADGARLDASKRFVKFLSDNSLDWAEGGQIPVRKSLRESERFKRMTAQRAFAEQIPHAAYYPRVLFVNEYLMELDTAVERVLRGSMTPQAALDLAARNIGAVMKRFPTPAAAQPPASTQPATAPVESVAAAGAAGRGASQ